MKQRTLLLLVVLLIGALPAFAHERFLEFFTAFGSSGHRAGQFRTPHGMAVSPDGKRLAVCDTGNHRVVILGIRPFPEVAAAPAVSSCPVMFEVEATFGGIWPYEGSNRPADHSDRYLEKDHANRTLPVRDLKGRAYHGNQGRVRPWDAIPMDRFCRPESVVWLDEVTIAVSDTDNHRVKAMRINGEILWVLGQEGWKDGYFRFPLGIDRDADGNLYVTEPRSNYLRDVGVEFQKMRVQGNRLQVFGPDLKPAKRFGNMHLMSGRFLKQCKDLTRVFPAPTGELFLADTGNHRILVLDRSLQTKQVIRRWPFYALRHPHGIHGDGAGQLVIADTGNHKVLILDSAFQLLQVIGTKGAGLGEFSAPREARFGPGKALYVLDTMNSRIQVFRSPLDRLDDLIQAQASAAMNPLSPVEPESPDAFETPMATGTAAVSAPPGMDRLTSPDEPLPAVATAAPPATTGDTDATSPASVTATAAASVTPESAPGHTGSDAAPLPNNDLPEEFEFADPVPTAGPTSDSLKIASPAVASSAAPMPTPSPAVASMTPSSDSAKD
jgi:sugar lactone lactonase YvrE